MEGLSVGVLGPLEVRRGDVPVPMPTGKQRLLLLRLAATDEPVGADALVDALWGAAAPPSAAPTLRAHVSRLRTTLAAGGDEDAVIIHSPAGYRLATEVGVDATTFERSVRMALRLRDDGQPRNAATLLGDALGLWRGAAFAEARFEPFAQPVIARLDARRLEAAEARIALHLELEPQLGPAELVVGELDELVAAHPLRERVHELLILALYRAGRQADALAAYARVRCLLRDELGVDPSPRLQALHRDVLSHAASVQPPADVGDAPQIASPTLRHLETAWDAATGDGADIPTLPAQVQAQLLVEQGVALRRTGQLAAARRAHAAAVRAATDADAGDLLSRAALGLAGPPEDTLLGEPLDEALLTRALLALRGDPGLQVRLRARLAIAAIDRGDGEAGTAMLQAAIAEARRCGDDRALAYALRARHRTWFDPAVLADRLALDDELVAIGERTGDVDVLAWGHRWRGIDLLEAGDLDGADAALDVLEQLTGTDDDAFHRWGVVSRRAGLALLRGPLEAAETQLQAALALTDAFGSTYTRSSALWLLVACRLLQGRAGEVRGIVDELVAAQPVVAAVRAWVMAEAGDVDGAAAAYAELTADGLDAVLDVDTIAVARLLSLAALAETAALLGEAGAAPALHDALLPHAGHLVVVPPGLTALATVDHCLGRLAGAQGDVDRATAHLHASIDRAVDTGALVLADRSRRALAALTDRHPG